MIDSALVGIYAPDKRFGSHAEGDSHGSLDQYKDGFSGLDN
jgi:hypothetical protein